MILAAAFEASAVPQVGAIGLHLGLHLCLECYSGTDFILSAKGRFD